MGAACARRGRQAPRHSAARSQASTSRTRSRAHPARHPQVGALWRGEYGFIEDAEDRAAMLAYSPLHNVKPVAPGSTPLPAMLLTTADHDDRVVPLHSLKMIATLQQTAAGGGGQTRPLLVRVETQAGHGAGKPITKVGAGGGGGRGPAAHYHHHHCRLPQDAAPCHDPHPTRSHQVRDEMADTWAFLAHELGATPA